MSFSIESIRKDFESSLRGQAPIVVVAPTGSGKSTQLPVWMAESCEGVVLVVEPRRIACVALAGFVASHYGEKVGDTVGYRVRFSTAISSKTRIEFVTPGVALRLLRGKQKEKYKSVLVDEFHERHWEVDLLVMLLRAEQERGSNRRLVLTSATVAGKELANAVEGVLLESEGRSYPVDILYATDASRPSRRDLEERVIQGLRYAKEVDPADRGDILVFLPGKGEIDSCKREISSAFSSLDFSLVPVHSELSTERLHSALKEQGEKRRIFLATNVAETSLTLPRVTTVVDSGLARMKIHRGGRSALALVPIAESLMMQRAGRAGRVAPGKCIRLWQPSYRPEAFLQPEVERIDLDDFLIQTHCFGWDGEDVLHAPWVTPPPTFAVEQAQQSLLWVGALDADYRVTDLGRDLANWPVSVYEATLLVGAPQDLQATLADMVALLQLRRSLLLPMDQLPSSQREELVEERKQLLGHCSNEVYMELTCLRLGHASKHGLHRNMLKRTRSISRQIRERLGLACKSPVDDSTPFPAQDALAKWLLEKRPEMGFVLRPRSRNEKQSKAGRKSRKGQRQEHPWANGQIEVMVEPFQPIAPQPSFRSPLGGVLLSHSWIGAHGLKVKGRGRMLLPCALQTLALQDLGETTFEEPRLLKERKSVRVVASVSQKLAGVTLHSEQSPLRGEALCGAMATFLLNGQWLKGAKEAVLDELHLMKLLHDWPTTDKDWKPVSNDMHWWDDPAGYLAQRLILLGVEESEDLELLAVEDLLPNVSEIVEVDPFAMEQLRRDFPRLWVLHGAIYQCDIRPRQGKVILSPANATAKKTKDPSSQLIPRFRGFQVDYRKASRVVSLRKR